MKVKARCAEATRRLLSRAGRLHLTCDERRSWRSWWSRTRRRSAPVCATCWRSTATCRPASSPARKGCGRRLRGATRWCCSTSCCPAMSGFDVCRTLRARRPEQAILMLTARGAEADVLEGFRCGADDYVTKPFSVAELDGARRARCCAAAVHRRRRRSRSSSAHGASIRTRAPPRADRERSS